MHDFPVLPSAADGLSLKDNGEEMGGLSLVLCILQCAPRPGQKADSSKHFIQKVPIGVFLSLTFVPHHLVTESERK